jgi:hypothetical protein
LSCRNFLHKHKENYNSKYAQNFKGIAPLDCLPLVFASDSLIAHSGKFATKNRWIWGMKKMSGKIS